MAAAAAVPAAAAGPLWESLTAQSWTRFGQPYSEQLERAWQAGQSSCTLSPTLVVDFTQGWVRDPGVTQVACIRRVDPAAIAALDATPELIPKVVLDDGSLQQLDPITAVQIVQWPKQSLTLVLRPWGDFYAFNNMAYTINLSTRQQINHTTGKVRALVDMPLDAPQVPSSFDFGPTYKIMSNVGRMLIDQRRQRLSTVGIDPSTDSTAPPATRRILTMILQNVLLVPATAAETADVSAAICTPVATPPPAGDICAVCTFPFSENPAAPCVSLPCKHHIFHAECIKPWVAQHMNCPVCKRSFGLPSGLQPTNGRMVVESSTDRLPGHELTSTGTYVIMYYFPAGVQEADHPSPGAPLAQTGRAAYLPISEQGTLAMRLLAKAWNCRMVFTVGISVTRGPEAGEQIIWNGIPHKTVFNAPGNPHAFPDDTFCERVIDVVTRMGITVQ